MKPSKPDSKERIEHIIDAIEKIERFNKKHTLLSFLKDDKSFFATLYQYTIIGEAVANIDLKILDKYNYPWYKVKSFRNFILHEYHAIDERVIWDTTKHILPDLKSMMKQILKNEF